MAVSAHDVARVLRRRLPGLPVKKLHKLLYYCQGHHLAATGTHLFHETISWWDMGPVVGQLWYVELNHGESPKPADLGESELNTIGYVLSRYGALTGLDLEHLTHQEVPYLLADRDRARGTSAKIEPEWIEEYFTTRYDDSDSDDEAVPDGATVRAWLHGAPERRQQPAREDTLEAIRARLVGSA